MLAGVGPFAIESGLVRPESPTTKVRIYNVNTQTLIEAVIQTPGGQVEYAGDTHIDGVTDPAAAIKLTFSMRSVPLREVAADRKPPRPDRRIEASCVDMAMPVMIMAAEAFGKTGRETPEELDADKAMLKKIEAVRLEAGRRMGMGTYRACRAETGAGVAAGAGREHRIALLHAARLPSLACRDRRACRRRRRGASRNRRERYIEPKGFSGGVLSIEHPRVTSRWT